MVQFTAKEHLLMTAAIKNLNGSILSLVNWDQAAIDANYKDATNAKTMWSRLAKKLSSAQTTTASSGSTDANENAGEGSSKTPAGAGKKRKAADKGGRPTKKAKAEGAHPVNKKSTEPEDEEAAGASNA